MKQINENTLMVPVTIETYLSKIQDICPKLMIKYKNGNEKFVRLIDLPSGNWQILGEITADKCTFDVEPYVETKEVDGYDFNGIVMVKIYRNYNENQEMWDLSCDQCHNSIDSFRSLINSHGLFFVNPYKFPDRTDEDFNDDGGFIQELYSNAMVKYTSAQSNTSPKYLVLRKI